MTALTSTFWNKYFTVYDTLNELLPYVYLLDELVSSLELKAGESVVDIGVGTGNVSLRIMKAGAVPTGIDISTSGISICKKKMPHCEFVVGNLMEPLPFPDNAFDKAVSNNVLYAIPPDERRLLGKELYRVVKPGGRVVLANISPGFSPLQIYLAHIQEEYERFGFLKTIYKILKFVPPTAKIFYYNLLIQRSAEHGAYSYLSETDQFDFLSNAGFVGVSEGKRVYANCGVLTTATKPHESK